MVDSVERRNRSRSSRLIPRGTRHRKWATDEVCQPHESFKDYKECGRVFNSVESGATAELTTKSLAHILCSNKQHEETLMTAQFEVAAEKLSWRCDLSFLPFTCTAEMTPLEDFIDQERAIRAIEFGLSVNKPGFNIFVTGLSGTGKTSIIRHSSSK